MSASGIATAAPSRWRWLAIASLGCGAAAAAHEPPSPSIDASTAFGLSSSLSLLTKTPVQIAQALSEVCVTSADAMEAESERAGPHAFFAMNVYASEMGVYALTHERASIPVGTIVLKEKLLADSAPDIADEPVSPMPIAPDWTAASTEPLASARLVVEAVGGMVKRAPGFDPDFGDWEYFYADADGGFTMGRLPECRECHARASGSDHLFGRGSSAWSAGLRQ